MGMVFWIKRFLVVLVGAFIIIGAAQLLKGHTPDYALREAVIWGVITASVFIAALYYRLRRGQYCAVCQHTPEQPGNNAIS